MPPNEKWQKDLDKRLEEHLAHNPEKPHRESRSQEVRRLEENTWTEDARDPETLRREYQKNGWDLIYSAPASPATNAKLPELQWGGRLCFIRTHGRKLIFFKRGGL